MAAETNLRTWATSSARTLTKSLRSVLLKDTHGSGEDADAVEAVAWSERIEFGGEVARAGYVPGKRVPVGRRQVGIEFDPIGDVGQRSPGQQHVRAGGC